MGRNFLLGSVAIGVLLVVLLGCKDTKSPVQTDAVSQQQTAAVTVEAAQAPVSKHEAK